MEIYIIKITGEDVRKIVPSINNLLEKEKKRLQRKGFHFKINRFMGDEQPEQEPEEVIIKDIQADYL